LELVTPGLWGAFWVAYLAALKVESMHTSASMHWHQNAMVATAYTAASKVLLRFKQAFKDNRWAR